MLPTLSVQVLLPLMLIAWLVFAPANSTAGYLIQAISSGLVLLALKLASLWVLLPWWLPLTYGLLWTLALGVRIVRRRLYFPTLWPSSLVSWFAFFCACALSAPAAYWSAQAIAGRAQPNMPLRNVPLPLGPGTYLVANGGSNEFVNSHLSTLDPTVKRYRAYRGQSYGVDLIEIDQLGLRATGLQPEDPSKYAIYGDPVYAPCDGTVIASRNDRPDMPVPVPDREVIAGNHVLFDCGEFHLLLAHFRAGSVRVRTGERAATGQLVGEVGNSGNTTEPHLHISAQLPGSATEPLSGDPLAIALDGEYWVRNDLIRKSPP